MRSMSGSSKYGDKKRHTVIMGADFETDMDPQRSHGWVCQWAVARAKDRSSNSLDYTEVHGYTIDEFKQYIDGLFLKESTKFLIYFHNFKYDVQWMWGYIAELIDRYPDSLTLYRNGPIIFQFGNVEFRDSLRKLPNTTVAQMGEMVGLPKLDSPREDFSPGWSDDLTSDDFLYVIHDAAIVALCMKKMHSFDRNTTYATISSDAWHSARAIYNKAHKDEFYAKKDTPFDRRFPKLTKEQDSLIRMSYLGGLNVSTEGGEYSAPLTHIDRNSMYPTIMSGVNGEALPYGPPIEIPEGSTPSEYGYDCWLMEADFKFHLKKGMLPILRFKYALDRDMEGIGSASTPISNTSHWHHLVITNIDLMNYMRFYDVDYDERRSVRYICFESAVGDLKPYIDYWYEIKRTASKGSPERAIAKLMLNSLYGRFGMGFEITDFHLEWSDEFGDYIIQEVEDEREEAPGYVPYAAFVTAYAREALCDAILTAGCENVIHCDTDSVIYKGTPSMTDSLGRTDALGDWKVESEPVRMIEGGVKRYIEFFAQLPQCLSDMNIKAAGVPQKCKHGVPIGMWLELIDDPHILCETGRVLGCKDYCVRTEWVRDALKNIGLDPDHMNTMKLISGVSTRIPGGIVLEESTFTMHDNVVRAFRWLDWN